MTPVNSNTLFRAAIVGLIALAFGCSGGEEAPKQRFVKLNVKTVDVSGRPVAMVRFYINGKKFGITDDDGDFQGKYEAKDGEVLAFNVEAPQGYSVPPNTDQSQWQIEVKYPKSGKLEVDFSATLQRPERDYLFVVRTDKEGVPVKIDDKVVGKTGPGGDILLRVSGVPGTKFTALAGDLKIDGGVFAEEDEIYLLTAKKAGPLGGGEAPAEEPVADTPMNAPVAAVEPEQPVAVAANDAPPTEPAPVEPTPAEPTPAQPTPAQPTPTRNEDPFAGLGTTTPSPAREQPTRNPPPVREPTPTREPTPRPPVAARDPDPEPVLDPEPTPDPEPVAAAPDPEPVPDPEPTPKAGLDDLFADGPTGDDPTPAALPPQPGTGNTPDIQATGVARTRSERDRQAAAIGDGLMDDGGETVDQNAMDQNTVIAAGRAPSAARMSREEISDRLDQINKSLDQSRVLQKSDVDFLAQIDRTHPGYDEANRLLAEYYFEIKEYKRQSQALEEATSRGRYKHDPAILLSLAKSYAFQKDYGKALKAMNRVETKMNRLPPRQQADAYRFHAEMLEFEFLRQYQDDPKRANVSLVDKAITKWERYRTFAQGTDPSAVSTASQKIDKLTSLKREMEL